MDGEPGAKRQRSDVANAGVGASSHGLSQPPPVIGALNLARVGVVREPTGVEPALASDLSVTLDKSLGNSSGWRSQRVGSGDEPSASEMAGALASLSRLSAAAVSAPTNGGGVGEGSDDAERQRRDARRQSGGATTPLDWLEEAAADAGPTADPSNSVGLGGGSVQGSSRGSGSGGVDFAFATVILELGMRHTSPKVCDKDKADNFFL